MKRSYLTLAAVAVVLAAAAAAAVITIELGLAFQSQTDSTDVIEVGDFVKATGSDSSLVSIAPVTYLESQDKESYVLTNVTQNVRGTLQVGTDDDVAKDLTSIISFQETGTWLFIETMSLTLQRETCFTVIVSTETTLGDITVITLDGTTVSKNTSDTISGSWKVWGVGDPVANYKVAEHPGDVYKGFIVLVKDTTLLRHHYNVLKVSGTNGSTVVELVTPKGIGSTVVSGSTTWRAWNEDDRGTTYMLKAEDVSRRLDTASVASIYDSMSATGIAGKQTIPISVRTGTYSFSIDIQYKSSIKIDPTPYQGDNMRSNITFLLSRGPYTVTYNIVNGPAIELSRLNYHQAFTSVEITASEHYIRAQAKDVSVTMGGRAFNDYSYSNGKVTIAENKVEGDLVITAVNTPESYNVTYNITNGPAIQQGTAYYHTEFVSAAITANPGYVVASSVTMTMGGNAFDQFRYDNKTGIVTIAADKIEGALAITAVNTLANYTVTYRITNGPAIDQGTANYNKSFTSSTITADTGYDIATSVTMTMGGNEFTSFTYSAGAVSINAHVITGDLVITAVNTPKPYTVTLSKDAHISAIQYRIAGDDQYTTYTEPFTVHYWESLELKAITDTGYHLVQWVAGITDNPLVIEHVTGAITYSAASAINTYAVTLSEDDDGITGFQYKIDSGEFTDYSVPFNVNHGQAIQLKAILAEGYTFTQWDDEVTDNPREIDSVTEDIAYSATSATS